MSFPHQDRKEEPHNSSRQFAREIFNDGNMRFLCLLCDFFLCLDCSDNTEEVEEEEREVERSDEKEEDSVDIISVGVPHSMQILSDNKHDTLQ